MDIITIILMVVSCTILGLGFSVIHQSRDKLNQFYFLNTLTIIGWVLTMIFYRISNSDTIVIWSKLLYVAASLIASNFLYFTYIFPKYNGGVEFKKKLYIFLPNVILVLFILIGDSIIVGAKVNTGVENEIYWGIMYPVYVIYILFYFNLAFFRLIRKQSRATDRLEKLQLQFLLYGYMSSGFISFATNLILPSFGYFALNWVGQVSTLLMALSAAYAIVKHQLFSAKVVATELLAFVLWIVLLIRFLIGGSATDYIVNGLTLVLTFFVGLFLIKSVIKEVSQRERIEKLAKDLQQANKRLTELDRQKSEFVSFATHQLRAPLTAMKGYASLILEGDMGQVSEQVRDGVNRIYESTKTLVNIVDDYLNISRIELGTMKYAFSTISLKDLIEDVLAELKPSIEKSGLDFSLRVDSPTRDYRITADRDKLKQVIANLVDNSVKYTPKGSVRAELSYDIRKHKFVFSIRDTGIGIAPEVLPRLFQKFSRADNANKVNIKGTGLGLYVVKEMIEAHHGTVRVESAGEGKGSIFVVELEPFVKAE